MCRLARMEFDVGASAPSTARHWVTDLLDRWELAHLSDVASLLTSEVVTNAVKHAASSPKLTASVAAGFLEIGVIDGDREHLPHMSDSLDPTVEGRRGLVLVDALAESWGTSIRPEGKEVWFVLDLDAWRYGQDCLCRNDESSRIPVGSGRQVTAISGPWDGSEISTEG